MIYTKHVIRIDTDQRDSNINTRSLKTIPSLLDINNFRKQTVFQNLFCRSESSKYQLGHFMDKKVYFQSLYKLFLRIRA